MRIPDGWAAALADEVQQPYFQELCGFLDHERAEHEVLPAADEVLAALEATPLRDVRIVLLGQDPYPTPGHAHGLCFSVQPGVKLPGSLRNIYKELQADLGIEPAPTGNLMPWARRGMLMLNAVLTVRAGAANSHKNRGWETFTDAVIDAVDRRDEPAVFVLWGAYAQKKAKRIDASRHAIVAGPHPSPLSAKLWFGSRPFSRIQEALAAQGRAPFDFG